MAVVLAGAASFIFIMSDRGIKEKVVDARLLDEVYLTEEKLDFYINEIMEKSAKDFKLEDGREKFVENFTKELEKYKKGEEYILTELIQVQQQMDEYEERNNVQVGDGKVTVELSIKIGIGTQSDKFYAIHTYNKKFEKTL